MVYYTVIIIVTEIAVSIYRWTSLVFFCGYENIRIIRSAYSVFTLSPVIGSQRCGPIILKEFQTGTLYWLSCFCVNHYITHILIRQHLREQTQTAHIIQYTYYLIRFG